MKVECQTETCEEFQDEKTRREDSMSANTDFRQNARTNSNWLWYLAGIAGAVVGAAIGSVIHYFLANNGLYALALVGVTTGMGCSYASPVHSKVLGGIACLISVLASVLLHWFTSAPFIVDESFWYFLTHIHQSIGFTIFAIMTGIGGVVAFVTGSQGRR